MTNTAYVTVTGVSAVPSFPLSDAFSGSSLDTSLWTTAVYEDGAGSITEGAGVLTVSPTNSGVLGIWSNTAHDLTGAQARVELLSASSPSPYFDLMTTQQDPFVGSSSLYKLETILGGPTGDIEFGYYNGPAAWTRLALLTYSASSMKFLRYRETAGTVYWETSPDSYAWTTQASTADPFPLTSLYASIGMIGEGTASFSNFNAPVTGPGVISASAIILSPTSVVSELSIEAPFSYGDSSLDIKDAVETALRTVADDTSLHIEFAP